IQVRNIPNKYTQAMLLEEVNAQHEGSYDFFYLPIDFKNRCNVGYCFINFLDAKSIPPFVHEFNGQRWKSFNSEKVCAVSFARIQGKQAMIQRFQNSSLLEKDDTYQPLLF
ncbi:RNA recognition motif 2, partial [Ochromonadaceae sp. CCMP2298]